MKRNTEQLGHFRCDSCQKWWSIGDAPEERTVWYCPWCGFINEEEEDAGTVAGKEEKTASE